MIGKGEIEWGNFSEPLKRLVRGGGPGAPPAGGGLTAAQVDVLIGDAIEFVRGEQGVALTGGSYTVPTDTENRWIEIVLDGSITTPATLTLPPQIGYIGRRVVVTVRGTIGTGWSLGYATQGSDVLVNGTDIATSPAIRVFRASAIDNVWEQVLAIGGTAAAASYTYARSVCLDNMDLSGTETQDGVNLAAGELAFCINQTTTHQNGLWVVASGAWSRPSGWAPAPNDTIRIREGSAFADTIWQLTNDTAPTLGTTAQTWRRIDSRLATLHATDANYTVKNNLGRLRVSFPNLTGNRVVTLPVPTDGQEVWVQIEANVGATRTVTATTPSGLINGNAVMTGPWASGLFIARNGNWNRMSI